MRISFSPMRCDDCLTVSKSGDVLTINGDQLDLSVIPEGASVPASAIGSEWIAGPIERIGGDLHVTLRLPHGPKPAHAAAFPTNLVDVADGAVALPSDPEAEEPA